MIALPVVRILVYHHHINEKVVAAMRTELYYADRRGKVDVRITHLWPIGSACLLGFI